MKKIFVILGIAALFLLKNIEFCYAETTILQESGIQECLKKIRVYYSNLDNISFSYKSEPLTVEGNLIKQGESFWTFTKEYNIGYSKEGTIMTEAIFYLGDLIMLYDIKGMCIVLLFCCTLILPNQSVFCEDSPLSQESIKLFCRNYHNSLLHKKWSCQYDVNVHKTQLSQEIFCDLHERKFKNKLQSSFKEICLSKDFFLEVTEGPTKDGRYSSYKDIPHNLFDAEIASSAIAPVLGYFSHTIPELIVSQNHSGRFFRHDGTFFIPDMIEKLENGILIKQRQEKMEYENILFQWKNENGIFIEIDILPTQDYMVRKILYENPQVPVGEIKSVRYSVSETQKIGTNIYPKTIEIQKEWQGGQSTRDGIVFSVKDNKQVETIAIKNINTNSNFSSSSFSPTQKIADGTKIYMLDVPQIEYVWINGKIVLMIDEVALAIARGGHKFIPGPKESRFWFMALGLILIFLGIGLKLYSMLKENNNKNKK
jgi:hypothetical protein